MPTEKKTESIHFKSFRRLAAGIVPDAPVVHTGTFNERAPDGAPDFLIRLPQGLLGIEHREVLKPQRSARQVERAFEQNCDEILRMGQEHAELRGLPSVRVSIFFGGTVPGTRRERLALARTLVDLVHDYMPANKQNVRLEYEHFQGRNLHGIDTVHINRYDEFPSAGHWVAPRAAWVMSECIDLLQSAIGEKAQKYDRYRQHCDECWLLLVADSTKPSAAIHPNEESLAHVYASPFDRTFFLDAGMGRLHQLKTTT